MSDLTALTPKQLAEKVRRAFDDANLAMAEHEESALSDLVLCAEVKQGCCLEECLLAEKAERLQAERDDLRTALEQIASLSPFMSPSTDGSVNKAPGIAREVLGRHPKADT